MHTARPAPAGRVKGLAVAEPEGWGACLGRDARTALLSPVLMVREAAVDHNISVMARYCADRGVSLAPHGKTPMSPELARRQLAAGAWAITAATTWQAEVFGRHGVPRVLLANQVTAPADLDWLARCHGDGQGPEVWSYVDSPEGVRLLAAALRRAGAARAAPVLVELGVPGGRTGCRTVEQALAVAEVARGAPELSVGGAAAFEGSISAGAATGPLVQRLLGRLRELAERLLAAGMVDGEEAVVTAGGSLFFDQVVAALADGWASPPQVRVVLRSGCYVTHDHGRYAMGSPLAEPPDGEESLHAALELWAPILSRPEPTRAIAGFGRRDAPEDAGRPVPLRTWRRDEDVLATPATVTVVRLDDQHAYLDLDVDEPLDVGDLMGFGVSHPCTALDKWRWLPLVDEDYRIVDGLATCF